MTNVRVNLPTDEKLIVSNVVEHPRLTEAKRFDRHIRRLIALFDQLADAVIQMRNLNIDPSEILTATAGAMESADCDARVAIFETAKTMRQVVVQLENRQEMPRGENPCSTPVRLLKPSPP